MTRLRQPRRGTFSDPEELAAYDAVTARIASMTGQDQLDPELESTWAGDYFGALLNSPTLTHISSQMGSFLRAVGSTPGSYSHADREFVDQVLSADFATNVVQSMHIPDAVAVGVRLEAIEALRYGREDELDADERLLADYIRKTVAGTVDDAVHSAMLERLGPRGLLEYTAFILWLQWIMRMMQALDVPSPSDEDIDAIIAGLRAGTVEVPDPQAHIK